MNTFKPIKGAYTRKFRPYSYAKNDGVAKDAVSGYLIRNGHTILSTEEDSLIIPQVQELFSVPFNSKDILTKL